MPDKIMTKLEILADAAKYDASCASGTAGKRAAAAEDLKGIGSLTGGTGICHSFTPDGRCISLLKILMTNNCIYDCHYCINRRSSNVRRARFTVQEVVDLTLNFYKRNYIEGLFLSSGIIHTSDYTMESMVRIAKALRLDHGFKGYIHLKTIYCCTTWKTHGKHAEMVGPTRWTYDELAATVKAYQEMLILEQSGQSYKKSAFNDALRQGPLSNRTSGSIE